MYINNGTVRILTKNDFEPLLLLKSMKQEIFLIVYKILFSEYMIYKNKHSAEKYVHLSKIHFEKMFFENV